MKLLACLAAIAIAAPVVSRGQEVHGPDTYLVGKLGVISPQHDDLQGFDTGLAFEADLGFRVHPNLALEAGIGYWRSTGSQSGIVAPGVFVTADAEISAIPVTLSLKGILPVGKLDVFGLAGAGMYFVSGSVTVRGGVSGHASDSGNAFGMHLGGGIAGHVTPQATLGVEVRYIFAKVRMFDANNGLDSFIAQGFLGWSF
ncbi:MAG TPA: outer membrane beta-barrel protein [Anaeromyxobacter sp.]|nr:outer membrane beta-barrel protein [Anaeromyxobacter sp.]